MSRGAAFALIASMVVACLVAVAIWFVFLEILQRFDPPQAPILVDAVSADFQLCPRLSPPQRAPLHNGRIA